MHRCGDSPEGTDDIALGIVLHRKTDIWIERLQCNSQTMSATHRDARPETRREQAESRGNHPPGDQGGE